MKKLHGRLSGWYPTRKRGTHPDTTRPFFAQGGASGIGLTPGSVGGGRSILLQGFGPQVYKAVQMLRQVDVAAEEARSQEDKSLQQRVTELEKQIAKLQKAMKDR